MARARKRGDSVYNARRRYTRQAERYEKMATQASGIQAGRYQALARTSLEKAIALYDDPKKAQAHKGIAAMSQRLQPRKPLRKLSDKGRKSLMQKSYGALQRGTSQEAQEQRRDDEAEAILSSEIGHRIYAGLQDIWEDAGYENRDQAIMDYYGFDSMMDVIEALEDAGIDLYADPESLERYDEIRSAIELALR